MYESESESPLSCLTLGHHVLYSPWNSPGKNTGMGTLSLLQGIFPTQGSNLGLLHCRRILYLLSQQGANFKCSLSKNETRPGASVLQLLLVLLAKCCPIFHPLSQGGFSLCFFSPSLSTQQLFRRLFHRRGPASNVEGLFCC